MQIPLQLTEQWSIVCIRITDLMELHRVFLPSGKREIAMRSLQICGNITLRGIFTSDIQYSIRVLRLLFTPVIDIAEGDGLQTA